MMQEQDNRKLWFKRKTYGWGWTPCTWQGWLCVAAYLVVIFLLALLQGVNPTSGQVVFGFFIPIAILTLLFLEIGYKKGEKPKWQWGKPKGILDKVNQADQSDSQNPPSPTDSSNR